MADAERPGYRLHRLAQRMARRQQLGAPQVQAQIEIPQPEPRIAAEPSQRLQERGR